MTDRSRFELPKHDAPPAVWQAAIDRMNAIPLTIEHIEGAQAVMSHEARQGILAFAGGDGGQAGSADALTSYVMEQVFLPTNVAVQAILARLGRLHEYAAGAVDLKSEDPAAYAAIATEPLTLGDFGIEDDTDALADEIPW